MKKVLLFSTLYFLLALPCLAYETVVIKYPDGEIWDKVYYKRHLNEVLLQYVPRGQTHRNWTRSIFVHSYNDSTYLTNIFMANNLAKMTQKNPTAEYKYMKLTDVDSIAGRCTEDYKGIHAQCEFFRTTRIHNGLVTLHYVNRNKEDFNANFTQWYEIIKKAIFYNSYYRNDRIMNKSEQFEI